MSYKKWVTVFLALISFSILFMAVLHFIIDPLQYFRRTTFYSPYIHGNYSREFNAGLIKNCDYETIILGSSLMGNSKVDLVNKELRTKSINLMIFGSTLHEASIVAGKAINTGKLKNCIWGIDIHVFKKPVNFTMTNDFPFHLYDENTLNDIKYILNFDLFRKMAIRLFKNNFIKNSPINSNYKTAYNWMYDPKFLKKGVDLAKTWIRFKYASSPSLRKKISRQFFDEGKKNFDINVYPHLKNNPEIKFYIMHVPYSILFWIDLYNQAELNGVIKLKKYIFDKSKTLPNVKIYDFQIDENIKGNLKNYMDVAHYYNNINDKMIRSLRTGEYLVRDGNYEQKLSLFKDQVKKAKEKYDQ